MVVRESYSNYDSLVVVHGPVTGGGMVVVMVDLCDLCSGGSKVLVAQLQRLLLSAAGVVH